VKDEQEVAHCGIDGEVGHDRSHAGQAIYSPATLALYDLIVLTLSNPLVWRRWKEPVLRTCGAPWHAASS
jgi:hypothetical protein